MVAAIISLQDPLGSHPDDIIAWIEVGSACLSPACLLSTLKPATFTGYTPAACHAIRWRWGVGAPLHGPWLVSCSALHTCMQ